MELLLCVSLYLPMSFNSFSLVYHFGNNVRSPSSARYPYHGVPGLILDKCVWFTGTWARG
jgi:hypothetical protein